MSEQTIDVDTAYGPVRGRMSADGTTRFLGLPYDAAPVGELRIAAPQPPAPWGEALDAASFGPTAPKPPLPDRLAQIMPDPSIEGDGWLGLDVWTPQVEPARCRSWSGSTAAGSPPTPPPCPPTTTRRSRATAWSAWASTTASA
ncbi:carboxylesterase family protein [Streptomyces sp. NPDC008122]|uniref:carboxylesterase family protein n=1 Tax=Streptomyces sp. NPDC008122 TaxID=3364810 RepID=UPI0036E91C5C